MLEIKRKLKELLTEHRFRHTLGVVEMARELALNYKIDIRKAELAALLHDCSKQFTIHKMKELVRNEEEMDEYSQIGELLHGFSGAIYARNVFNIEDKDILNAVKYHTIGRKNMSELEKIIYLADAIEPNRTYAVVHKLRKLAFQNLDEAILMEANRKIEFLIRKGVIIHPNTIEMRNQILMKEKI